jgi:hypothetical protein
VLVSSTSPIEIPAIERTASSSVRVLFTIFTSVTTSPMAQHGDENETITARATAAPKNEASGRASSLSKHIPEL